MKKLFVSVTSDFPPGEARRVGENPAIAVFNIDGDFYAIADLCTHGAAAMSDGYIEDDCTVECPVHNARFCLKTGKALTQPATIDAETFEVVVEGDEVFVFARQGVDS